MPQPQPQPPPTILTLPPEITHLILEHLYLAIILPPSHRHNHTHPTATTEMCRAYRSEVLLRAFGSDNRVGLDDDEAHGAAAAGPWGERWRKFGSVRGVLRGKLTERRGRERYVCL